MPEFEFKHASSWWTFGIPMLKPERCERQVSTCPHCRSRLQYISPAITWCPSCRTDIDYRAMVSRPHYELDAARFFFRNRGLGVVTNCIA